MTTARRIITDALRFGLNRLSPGEAVNADDASVCLDALNNIVDAIDGAKGWLFREVLTAGTVSGSGALGTTWPTLTPGDQILGASYNDGQDIPIWPVTMEQYQSIAVKSTGGSPMYFAHDGAATVYFWPVPNNASITLRTKQAIGGFADLDTVYVMPAGYSSALSSLLAEKLAPVMGGLTAAIAREASMARGRLTAQSINPAILNGNKPSGNILSGW